MVTDLTDRITSRLPLFIAAVVAMSFLLLMIVFRSILVPLKAALMNLLSIAAAYGVLVAVFQWGWGNELIGLHSTMPINPFLPLIMFAILFGLSMDYEVFLLSRVREEYVATGDNHEAVVRGLSSTARVITSAALIMISVFGAFVLGDDPNGKLFGVGLAVAVLLDATLVRMVLVPATMSLVGRANWWLPAGSTGSSPTSTSRADRSPRTRSTWSPSASSSPPDPVRQGAVAVERRRQPPTGRGRHRAWRAASMATWRSSSTYLCGCAMSVAGPTPGSWAMASCAASWQDRGVSVRARSQPGAGQVTLDPGGSRRAGPRQARCRPSTLLLAAAVSEVGPIDGTDVVLRITSAVPPGSSPGTSAAICVGMVAALDAVREVATAPRRRARGRAAHRAEAGRRGPGVRRPGPGRGGARRGLPASRCPTYPPRGAPRRSSSRPPASLAGPGPSGCSTSPTGAPHDSSAVHDRR